MQDNTSALRVEDIDVPVDAATSGASTIWQELDNWAQNFRPWQKFILSCAIRTGKLTDEQVEQAYQKFLYDNNLSATSDANTMLAAAAHENKIEILTHWLERDSDGRPGQVSLDDCPDATPQYRNTQKAAKTLADGKAATGSVRLKLIRRGMGELRRTIEEIVPHFLFKQVVNRWTDRVIVTSLKKINWDNALIKQIEDL